MQVNSNGNKENHEFEFFGPTVGPIGIIVGLPIVCYGLIFLCNANGCLNLQDMIIPQIPNNFEFFNLNAVGVVIGWFVYLIVLHLVLPGKVVQGVKLKNGDQLKYKLNGFLLMVVSLIILGIFGFYIPIIDLSWLYYNFSAALTASLIISVSLSVYLYASSFTGTKLISEHGSSGYFIYDFFMGRELNPRIGNLDLKEFCELYPGLIGWVVLNLGMLAKQYSKLGRVTNSMMLINTFQLIYVLDALWFEQSILTTMDITTDGFGFMLAFGDLTWVPFTYSLQARFLADNPQDLSLGYMSLVLGIFCLGYGTFRGANGQKDTFRRNPSHPSVFNLMWVFCGFALNVQIIVNGTVLEGCTICKMSIGEYLKKKKKKKI
eukprot:TRINITY_DN5077_c0_g2_i3.p2 TRINITY_DN5077_c0_g2~~TRINITY_DN5077_c0_g2_i3.p2  ORF type:complete len:376 (-),score=23.95 TRINITY_DN5077_c0_g2_i3:444-1571(-)